MSKHYYRSGEWNFICDSCGQKLKSGVAQKRWDGYEVCPECYEQRHSQDFVRAKKDKIAVPWVRPIADTFLPVTFNERPADSIGLNEAVIVVQDMYRDVPSISGVTIYEDSYINAEAINGFVINGSPSQLPVNTLFLSEDIRVVTDYVLTLSDTMTLSEVVHEAEGEGVMESMTMTESLTFLYNTAAAINGSAINAQGIN